MRAVDRPLFVPGFVRLLAPRRGLLKGASLGIVSSMRFLRKVVWRSVRTVLARAQGEGSGADYGEHDGNFHRGIRR